MKNNNKILKTINYIFLVLIFSLGILFILSVLPIPGTFDIKIVKSGSMEPAISTGSIVFVKDQERYQINDIITFKRDPRSELPTTHRIVAERIESGEFIFETKGDANEDKDVGEVKTSQIIGRVIFHLPIIGYILDFVRQPFGFILLFGIPVVMLISDEISVIIKAIRENKFKKDGK